MAKERPILFSAPMVRALLDGSKTQTRRICKQQPYSNGFHFDGREILCHNDYLPPSAMLMDYRDSGETYTTSDMEGWDFCCPYGQPGDRLWVRETTAEFIDYDCIDGRQVELGRDIVYRADGEDQKRHSAWRPSIHMPRERSRILLEITGVRAERLQDISQEDARAEGITDGGCTNCGNSSHPVPCGCDNPSPDWADGFFGLWQSINGSQSLIANPWVWVIEFNRVLP